MRPPLQVVKAGFGLLFRYAQLGLGTLREVGGRHPDLHGLHLYFDLNDGCNLRCTMCTRKRTAGAQHVMPKEVFEGRFLPAIESVELFQFGCLFEPLMVPYFEEAVALMGRRLRPGVRGKLISNGTLLSESKAKALVDSNIFDVISFSMDGATQATYETIRRGARHAKVLRNVGRLVEYRQKAGSRALVQFNFTIMRENVHELPALVELAASLGMDGVTTHKLFPDDYGAVDRAYHERLTESLSRAQVLAEEKGLRFVGQSYETVEGETGGGSGPAGPRRCGFLGSHVDLRLDCRGTVRPTCVRVPASLGSVAKRELRNVLGGLRARYMGRCFACPDERHCVQCHAYRSSAAGAIEARDLSSAPE